MRILFVLLILLSSTVINTVVVTKSAQAGECKIFYSAARQYYGQYYHIRNPIYGIYYDSPDKMFNDWLSWVKSSNPTFSDFIIYGVAADPYTYDNSWNYYRLSFIRNGIRVGAPNYGPGHEYDNLMFKKTFQYTGNYYGVYGTYGYSGNNYVELWPNGPRAYFNFVRDLKNGTISCGGEPVVPVKSLGGPSCDSNVSPYVGNPIHAGTGNKYQAVKDYSNASGFTFTRYYNSLDENDIGLGVGWRHTLSRSLTIDSSKVEAQRADGKVYTFTKDASGNWTTDPDTPVTLSSDTAGWTYQQGEHAESYNAQGQLISISDANGVKYTLTYNSNGDLEKVTDRYYRQITFSYTSTQKLLTVSFLAGESVTYSYDTNNNLIKAEYADGTSRQYLYEDTRFPHALTGRVDENGQQISNYEYDDKGRGILTEKAGGINRFTLVYNDDGTTTVTDPSGAVRIYHFETIHNVTKVVKIDSPSCTSCSTDTDAATYDENGFIASKTDKNGNVTSYINNAEGLQTSRTEAVGTPEERIITTAWDVGLRKPVKITEPGKITEFTYENGNLISRTETDSIYNQSRTFTYTYNNFGQVKSIDGARTDVNDVTQFDYDAQGNLYQVTNALSHVTKITQFDLAGRPQIVVDANGLTTTLNYDVRGRLKSRDTGGEVMTLDYDNVGNLKTISLTNGRTLNYGYDQIHRLTTIQDQAGNKITYTLDNAGNRKKEDITDASGVLVRTRQQTYNELSQLVDMIGAQSQTTSFGYDGNGNRITVTDTASKVTTSAFDALNRLISVTDPLDGVTRYGYDNQDNLVSVTAPNGVVTTYRYDGFGNRIEQTSADTGVTTYTYDAAGNVHTQKDAKEQVTSYLYDVLNRVTEISYHDGSKDTFTYDVGVNSTGRLTQVANDKNRVEYTYNLHGRVTSKAQTVKGLTLTTKYGYNASGQVETMTMPSGKVIGYEYSDGQITSMILDGEPLITQVRYDAFGPVNGWTWSNGSVYQRGYDLDGQLIAYSLANNTRSVGYDSRGNIRVISDATVNQSFSYDALNRLEAANDDTTLQQIFDYDANGNRLSMTDNGVVDTYDYLQGSNRLTRVNSKTPRDYVYDANGNIILDGNYEFGYDSRNRMISVDTDNAIYEHNSLGQRVFKFVRHPFDMNKDNVFNKKDIKLYHRMVKKGDVDSLNDCDGNAEINKKDVKCLKSLYKALKKQAKRERYSEKKESHKARYHKDDKKHGRSHKYDDDSHGFRYGQYKKYPFDIALLNYKAETYFVYDEQGQLVGEYNFNGDVRQEVIYLGNIPVAVIKNNTAYYIFTDHLTTPRAITDTENVTVWLWNSDPFGKAAANEDPDNNGRKFRFNYRLPGQYYDVETAIHYNYFRDYDPSTGRYVQSDPIGLAGGLNTYGYVLQNPINYYDPDGLRVVGHPGKARGGKGVGQGGRIGVFGCIAGCVSYIQGDSNAKASLSPTIGGGLMICSSPKTSDSDSDCKDKGNGGLYDPNNDNSTNFSPSYTPKGAGLGIAKNSDGSVCVVLGPFVSPAVVPVSLDLGDINE